MVTFLSTLAGHAMMMFCLSKSNTDSTIIFVIAGITIVRHGPRIAFARRRLGHTSCSTVLLGFVGILDVFYKVEGTDAGAVGYAAVHLTAPRRWQPRLPSVVLQGNHVLIKFVGTLLLHPAA